MGHIGPQDQLATLPAHLFGFHLPLRVEIPSCWNVNVESAPGPLVRTSTIIVFEAQDIAELLQPLLFLRKDAKFKLPNTTLLCDYVIHSPIGHEFRSIAPEAEALLLQVGFDCGFSGEDLSEDFSLEVS